ncbi:hypothetical protein Sme01_59530 [Sphaerisporangium melleum]|uniref:Subtilisin inhibitor domain-containing protein n=1 Tax=Sphaerisporangium melleum TaxID=321316 RepID=A0A917R7K8_9ACTN|nr:hypothetical protein [Sphaerisporangium melleum]GGK92828.1 hypothetical protein GCM10007964_39200 [Sphaerisporangium melleum]GII73477.1 hypothetical protein Sme01_59530 [Sphaerisporangium melleum]
MRLAQRCVLTVLALAALLVTPLGGGAAWASPGAGSHGAFAVTALRDLPDGVARTTTVEAEESTCTPEFGPGVRITFYCDIKQLSTLLVYCEGVTVIVTLNPGRWKTSGSCPGYRGYRLVPGS